MDAYLAALFVPNTLYLVLVAGTISPIFITVFSQHANRSHEDALLVFRVISTFAALILASLALLGMLTARLWLPLIFSGFTSDQLRMSVRILYVVFPAVVFLGLAGIVSALLNSLSHFTVPAASPVTYAAATVPVLLFAPRDRLIQWLSAATAAGLAMQLFVQLPAAAALGVQWRPHFNFRHPALRQLVRLGLPLLAYLVVANTSLLIERNIASRLSTGAISVVNYATRLFTIPSNLLIAPLAVVFYPVFAREAALLGRGNLERELRSVLRLTVFLALPISCWMVVHALPLTRLVFERGQFDLANSTRTAGLLAFYCIGLLPNALAVILLRAFYAIQDTVTPLLVEGANLAYYAWAAPRLTERYGMFGLGAARAGSFALVALILLLALRKKLPKVPRIGEGSSFVLKTACGSLVMCIVTWGAAILLNSIFQQHNFLARAMVVTFLASLGGIVYISTCHFLRVPEVNSVLNLSSCWLGPRLQSGQSEGSGV